MTVLELKLLLADAPDDMEVMVAVENHLHPGMFAFAPACPGETGISMLGTNEDDTEGGDEVFLVLPHGHGVSEDDIESGHEPVPEVN